MWKSSGNKKVEKKKKLNTRFLVKQKKYKNSTHTYLSFIREKIAPHRAIFGIFYSFFCRTKSAKTKRKKLPQDFFDFLCFHPVGKINGGEKRCWEKEVKEKRKINVPSKPSL